MKKKYLIIFLFFLFFNKKNIYADTAYKFDYLNEEISECQTLFNSLCDEEECTITYANQDTKTETSITTHSLTDDNKYKFLQYGATLQIGNGSFSILEKKLKENKCGDKTCWEYTLTEYCGTYNNNKSKADDYKNYYELCRRVQETENPSTESIIVKDNELNKDITTCKSLLSDEGSKQLLKMLKFIVNIVKISIPILLIGLGIIDFARAVFAGSEDEIKKIQNKFIKRVIIGICIFLIPTLLKVVLNIANGIWDNISPDFCGIL